uniref:Uncharacterized protein n=1 Tax=Setaria viridis TaxID=4556 RepID=A0A4U6VQ83_SETVI|nr:hypothetical protein SEVIR_2G071400v2 [Setaria viridis]
MLAVVVSLRCPPETHRPRLPALPSSPCSGLPFEFMAQPRGTPRLPRVPYAPRWCASGHDRTSSGLHICVRRRRARGKRHWRRPSRGPEGRHTTARRSAPIRGKRMGLSPCSEPWVPDFI